LSTAAPDTLRRTALHDRHAAAGAQRAVALQPSPQAGPAGVVHERPRGGVLRGTDRQHTHLHRRQPQRQPAVIPLQQRGHDPLHRPDGAAVDHHHRLPRPVGGVVGEVEALRLVEVQLHGGDGLLVPAPGADLQVQLRAVERGLSLRLDQRHPAGRPRRSGIARHPMAGRWPEEPDVRGGPAQGLLGLPPLFVRAEVCPSLTTAGQAHVVDR
jgi:hypothetical protein